MSHYLVPIYTKSISLILVLGSATSLSWAEAVTDSSWGKTPQTLRGDFTIPETLGKRSGDNLFHSFEKFNINRGESATFTTTTPTIANVIARVSGRESSSINGALSLQAPAGSQPNFFFINPNGVTFGAGAQINVPGAFHVSTANQLEFADGTKFTAGKGPDNTLTVAAPEAFGFLGREQSAAAIKFLNISSGDDSEDDQKDWIHHNSLRVNLFVKSKTFDVVAGEVEILNSNVLLGGPEYMRMIATGTNVVRVDKHISSPIDVNGPIKITNSIIFPFEPVHFSFEAGDIHVSNTLITLGNGGTISLYSSGDISLFGRSIISSTTSSRRTAGAVNIKADNLSIVGSGSEISSAASSESSGKTGNININVNKSLTVTDSAVIDIENRATVLNTELITPGQLSISAKDININNNASISAASAGNVKASDIFINASNTFQVNDASVTTSATNNSGGSMMIDAGQMIRLTNGGITTSVEGNNGNGGNIRVNTPVLLMEQGYIQANTSAKDGSGGKVFIDTKGLVASHGALSIGELLPIQIVPGLQLNVIQAAAPEGVSGEVTLLTPQTDIAGQLAELEQPNVDTNAFSRNVCRIGAGSSLTQAKRGNFSYSPLRVLRPLVQTPPADRKNFSSSNSDSSVY